MPAPESENAGDGTLWGVTKTSRRVGRLEGVALVLNLKLCKENTARDAAISNSNG